MGCGQSKINFYPRRSKSNGKRNGAKKSGAVAKDTDEEEGSGAEEVPPEEPPDETSDSQHVLPIADHQPTIEVSDSQQNFFKMLDEKIEQGKDYDSSSETEIESELERKRKLIEHWNSLCKSTQSSLYEDSPTLRRMTRSVSKISERQCAPSTSQQCYRQESPPARRTHSVQTHEPRPSTSDWNTNKSPVKRSQSASGPNWKNSSKVAPFPKQKERKDDALASCSKDSQITYNPTFQNHSPAHSMKSQPYKAQIVTYPLTQQVTPPSPPKFIAPPEEYKDPDMPLERSMTASVTTQSQIYYISGSSSSTKSPDIAQQRQQTAIHLQQYVAMKQAQQQMFTSYMQRSPLAAFPTVEYHTDAPRMCEGEELAAQYGHPGLRAQSAPHRAVQEVAHTNVPLWSPLAPVMTVPWAGGQVPAGMQYYPQSQFVPMFRANSAGSAGTLTRCHKREGPEKSVQTINVVRGKTVAQIVSVEGQGLAVSGAGDSPGAASGSTDSGVSPGSSSTTPPTTSANDTFNFKPKKNKTGRILKVSKSLDS